MPESDPRDLVFTPADSMRLTTQYLEHRREGKSIGIPLGLKSMDEFFIPAVPGDLITILGRPGNGKTGFMMRWARWRAKWLEQHEILDRVVVYATLEQTVEELTAFQYAAEEQLSITAMARGEITPEQWNHVLAAGVKRVTNPLWIIGHSAEAKRKRPKLTVNALALALESITDQMVGEENYKIDMLFVDYLQRIPYEGRLDSKTEMVSENLDRLKDAGGAMACPVIAGVQAKREVDKYDPPIPQTDDGQWTSNIEQTSDKMISLVRPALYKKEGERFGEMKVQGRCQMLCSILKQKLGPANKAVWVYFDPVYNRLDELELQSQLPIPDDDGKEIEW